MGALHAGHLSLVQRARTANDLVVASIFVNPLQFSEQLDIDSYPRPLDVDTELAKSAGVDVLFVPTGDEMYPDGKPRTRVNVSELDATMEGAQRPGHFDGVATVVSKLFNIVGDCRTYFGEKDWQQVAVVEQMVRDLNVSVEIVRCAIVRESDGLALSSRNVRLDERARQQALCLSQALRVGVAAARVDGARPTDVSLAMWQVLADEHGVEPQYAEVVDEFLREPNELSDARRLLVAAKVAGVRLIDNCDPLEFSV